MANWTKEEKEDFEEESMKLFAGFFWMIPPAVIGAIYYLKFLLEGIFK